MVSESRLSLPSNITYASKQLPHLAGEITSQALATQVELLASGSHSGSE